MTRPRPLSLAFTLLRAWVQRDLLTVEVDGASMQPTLTIGDRVLCSRRAPVRRGTIVAFVPSSRQGLFIKRVVAVAGDVRAGFTIPAGTCWIEGDDLARSADSRHFGPIALSDVRGTAIARVGVNGVVDLRG